jgi:ADP-ribose pyrophosphatase YjhB (NUDIX family)
MSNKTYRTGVGCGVAVIKGNKILLGKRHDDPEKADSELHGEGRWSLPGGKVDFRETFTDAVCREAKEETGIILKKETLQFVSLCSDIVEDAHFVTAGFICTDFDGEPKVMEPDEMVKWEWFDKDSLPTPMYEPSLKVIEHWKEGKIFNIGE